MNPRGRGHAAVIAGEIHDDMGTSSGKLRSFAHRRNFRGFLPGRGLLYQGASNGDG